jgi:hypothetical protein
MAALPAAAHSVEMCNQIGAVSAPTAPLPSVTTSIVRTPIDETNRHVWTFMPAEPWCCC